MVQKIIVILGVPVAVYTYFDSKMKESHDRRLMINEKLDDKYWTYQQLCIAHPQLDVSDVTDDDTNLKTKPAEKLSDEEKVQERAILYLVIALFERSYLLFHDQSTTFKQEQWGSWLQAMTKSYKKENFRQAWASGKNGYDKDFRVFFDKEVAGGQDNKSGQTGKGQTGK